MLKIYFSSSPNDVEISIARLKYNKDFALSFHLDDGHRDIYTHAFPLLEGGSYSYKGVNYNSPGLFYTDACGHNISFTMASAIYSFSTYNMTDFHGPDAGNTWIKWNELAQMHDSGWAVYNHGLTDKPADNIPCSFLRNHSYVYRKLSENGIQNPEMSVISLPFGNLDYANFAFEYNYKLALHMHNYGTPSLSINQLKRYDRLILGTTLLEIPSDLSGYIDKIAKLSVTDGPQWACFFTHQITSNQFSFEEFKEIMEYIANTYGSNGSDKVWVASAEEVYDYLALNSGLQIVTKRVQGDCLEVSFAGELPENLRWYSSSLILKTEAGLDSISFTNVSTASFCTANKETIINLNWDIKTKQETKDLAEFYVTLAELVNNKKQCILNTALDYIILLPESDLKSQLIQRLENIPGTDISEHR